MIELLKILIGIAFGCFSAWTLTLFWLWYVATPFQSNATNMISRQRWLRL